MKKYMLSLLMLGGTIICLAQTPLGINYQAILRNSEGTIRANETIALQIGIIDDQGTPFYTEIHNTITNDFGLANVVIGQGTTSDDLSVVDWSAGPYFLEITVNGTTIGTNQLLSVPYALFSQKSQEVEYGDNWGSQEIISNKSLDGNGTASDPLEIAQQGAVTGQVLKWNGSEWGPEDLGVEKSPWQKNGDNIFYNSGKIGIGAENPKDQLHVEGSGTFYNGSSGLQIIPFSATSSSLRFLKDNGIFTNITFKWGATLLGGYVGIGTDNPKEYLHVNDRIRVGDDLSYGSVYGELIHEGGGSGFKINANANGGWADLHLQTDGTTRLFIESGGNVGIGTTSPSKRLYVNGSAGGTQAWNASDVRYKKNIHTIQSSLDGIMHLRGVQYQWRDGSEDESTGFDNKKHYGVIAQEVEEIFPYLVDQPGKTDEMKHVEYNGLIGILVEAIKELKQQNDDLRKRIEALEH